MAEFDEGKIPERDNEKETKKRGKNPLQSFLSRKVKIFGREIPMPLLMLGALVLGIIVFSILGKKRGNSENAQQTDDTQSSFGFSQQPNSLGESAQNSMMTSEGELSADLGQAFTPSPLPSFEPLPIVAPSPLPDPQLPYADFGSSYFEPMPIADLGQFNMGLPQPVEQQFYPIRDVIPSMPPTLNRSLIEKSKPRTLPPVSNKPAFSGSQKPVARPLPVPVPKPAPTYRPPVSKPIAPKIKYNPPVVRPPTVIPVFPAGRPKPVPPPAPIYRPPAPKPAPVKPKPVIGTKPLPGKAGFLR